MRLIKFLSAIIPLCLTFLARYDAKDPCTKLIIKTLLNGYHCPADIATVTLPRVPLHLCTHYCVSRFRCPTFSYHVNTGVCFLHNNLCVELVKDTEHLLSYTMLNWPVKSECISWRSYQGNIPDDERVVQREKWHYVARLNHKDEVLPGRLIGDGNFKSVSLVNGVKAIDKYADSSTEYLVVSDQCSIAWAPYVAGNTMPSRAVLGGRRANGGHLFVASLWTTRGKKDSKYKYGYYDPESQLGYTINSRPASNNSVDILVEI